MYLNYVYLNSPRSGLLADMPEGGGGERLPFFKDRAFMCAKVGTLIRKRCAKRNAVCRSRRRRTTAFFVSL
jgi:hypothetical protein